MGVVGLLILGMVSFQKITGGPGANTATYTRVTLAPLPSITASSKLTARQRKAREMVDHADSKRISGDLVGAYKLYIQASKVDKKCRICESRIDSSRRLIDNAVSNYERGGGIAFANGRFNEAASRWTAAIELLGDIDPDKTKDLKRRVKRAKREARK